MSKKIPLLLFSGGLDSSYSLLSLLTVSDVDILIVKSEVIGDLKNRAEDIAQKKVIDYCNNLFENGSYRYRIRKTFTVTNVGETYNSYDRLGQPALWLDAAMRVVNEEYHSCLVMSYCAGDSILPFLDRLQKWWVNMYSVRRGLWSGKIPKLVFPLCVFPKKEMINKLIETSHFEVLDLIWTCEKPVEKKRRNKLHVTPCGKCIPCQNLTRAKEDSSSRSFWTSNEKPIPIIENDQIV